MIQPAIVILLAFVTPASAMAQAPPGPRPVPGLGGQRPAPPRDNARRNEEPRGTAVIRGVVVAADTGGPIRRAQVRVSGQGDGSRLATTDAQGRFEVRDLPAGRYTVSASKGGFVSLQYGQKRPSESGTPLEIADAQLMDKIVIGLPRGSVIAGRITDEFGEPVANANVTAMRYGFAAGARRLLPGGGQNSRDSTDDQGQFRLFGLPPGEYIVSASFRTGRGESADPAGENSGYAATYYPGTTNAAEAQRVTLGVAQEHNSIVFSLVATRLVRVTGTVLNSQGAPVANGSVTLTAAGGRVLGGGPMSNFSGRIDGSGQFRVFNVPPGRYIAQVRSGRGRNAAAGTPEYGRQEVTVGAQDLDGVVLVTAPGGRVAGTVVSDSGTPPGFAPQQISIAARVIAVDPAVATPNFNGRVNADWTFEIAGVFEPRLFRPNLPQGWTLKSVTLNAEDITDIPIEIPPGQTVSGIQVVVSQRSSAIHGRVVDSRNNPVTDATVVIFPADEEKWVYQSRFIRAARPDQEGRFQLTGLPPSDRYLTIAVQGLEEGQAGDPEFLGNIRDKAASITLGEGETKTLDLRVTR
jgi:protocatechuate 3,4-dioxygenase beta subunit